MLQNLLDKCKISSFCPCVLGGLMYQIVFLPIENIILLMLFHQIQWYPKRLQKLTRFVSFLGGESWNSLFGCIWHGSCTFGCKSWKRRCFCLNSTGFTAFQRKTLPNTHLVRISLRSHDLHTFLRNPCRKWEIPSFAMLYTESAGKDWNSCFMWICWC